MFVFTANVRFASIFGAVSPKEAARVRPVVRARRPWTRRSAVRDAAMYVERKGGEEEALVPEEEHAEFVKLRDEGEAPEPEPTHTPMTWTKLAYCSALLALLITIPCVLYPPSELAKYWYGPLMGLASTIPSAGAPVAGGIVFFPILMLAGFSPSEAVAYAAATQMIGVGLFVPGSFIVYEAYAVFLHDILFWGTFSGGIGVSLTLFVFERVLRRLVFFDRFRLRVSRYFFGDPEWYVLLIFTIVVVVLIISVVHDLQNPRGTMRRRPSAGSWREMMDQANAADVVPDRAGKARGIPNFEGSDLGRLPLVSADFWTRDHPSERSRNTDVFFWSARARTLTLQRRWITRFLPRSPTTRSRTCPGSRSSRWASSAASSRASSASASRRCSTCS